MAAAQAEEACLLSGMQCEPGEADVERPISSVGGSVAEALAARAGGSRRAWLAAGLGLLGAAALLAAAARGLGGHGGAVGKEGINEIVNDQAVYQTGPMDGQVAVSAGYADPAATAAYAGSTATAATAGLGYDGTAAVGTYGTEAAGAYGTAVAGTDGTTAAGTYGTAATDAYGVYVAPTPAPYRGPTEFSGKGGPPMVAGTKLISAGADDETDNDEYSHPPAPSPPPDYAVENPPITMYMYRAQSDENYPMRNVNTGDLAGVLWYLHNEIVAFPDMDWKIRHFNITRIIRFKVTVQNPPEFYERHHRKFAAFVAFGAGKCSVPNCDSIWKKYGAVVGCQAADTKVANYRSMWQTQTSESHCTDGCNAPLWFSLPGPCPSHEYGAKTSDCIWYNPGGDCGKDKEVNGARDCTYYAQWYGEIRLDELLNFTRGDGRRGTFYDFTTSGGREYDKNTDMGVYTNFWDNIHSEKANRQRIDTVRWLFSKKYPKYPTELQETDIKCDFNGWRHMEFAPDPTPGVDR